jgi:type I restriction enzyme R subunit
MRRLGLSCVPSEVSNLKGDTARAAFINHFKEVQRLKTQLDQYTDLTADHQATIEQVLPNDDLRGFKGQYLETAKRLRDQQGKDDPQKTNDDADQLDFEFVLFASAVIDYDYIMSLITTFSAKGPDQAQMTRDELVGLISADAKFINERDEIAEYIGTLKAGEGLSELAIREGYARFKAAKNAAELVAIASKHGLATQALQSFVDAVLDRMIFDGEQLGDLMAPLGLGWKARTQAELALMEDVYPLLVKRAGGREISGLSAYE